MFVLSFILFLDTPLLCHSHYLSNVLTFLWTNQSWLLLSETVILQINVTFKIFWNVQKSDFHNNVFSELFSRVLSEITSTRCMHWHRRGISHLWKLIRSLRYLHNFPHRPIYVFLPISKLHIIFVKTDAPMHQNLLLKLRLQDICF